ncbi:hypothetical protein ACLOJK_029379 [Asimina triloba]
MAAAGYAADLVATGVECHQLPGSIFASIIAADETAIVWLTLPWTLALLGLPELEWKSPLLASPFDLGTLPDFACYPWICYAVHCHERSPSANWVEQGQRILLPTTPATAACPLPLESRH